MTLSEIEAAGYTAGLNEAGEPSYRIGCSYDGRTREGKAWWRGFMAGDAERCQKARAGAQ